MYGITSGSVQQKFNKTDFKNSKLTIKDENQLIDFHNHVSIYFNKIESNQQQIQTLTQLRDTLLPKLMSGAVSLSNCGEVRVKI
jgi:type I restriction enzyme S subunit